MPTDPLFHMVISDVFSIAGRGIVVTGTIDAGSLRTGDEVVIRGSGRKTTVVAGIEKLNKKVDAAGAGDTVGVLLSGISRSEVAKADELHSPDGALPT